MELKEFIKTALADITDAVKESQAEIGNGAIISPPFAIETGGVNQRVHKYKIYDIDFDIAITSVNGSGQSRKLGLEVCGIGYKNEKTDSDDSTSVSRIKFSIPVVYPARPEK